jgi:prepilin-type N-terminal cleavage/methylation domain-containing protein
MELVMSKGRKTRFGFTLVEILVVIAIIGILAALTSAGVFVTIGIQQRRNTVNTIQVLDKILHNRWNETINKAKQETPSPQVMALAGGDNARARVLWAKVRLVEAFPQTYAELSPTDPKTIVNYYVPVKDQKTHFKKYQSLAFGKTGGPNESAACLLMALKTLGADGVAIDDQLKYAITEDGTNKINMLIDSWGRPLRFTRFDISLPATANPAQSGKALNFADPVDPEGSLLNLSWYPSPLRAQYESGAVGGVPGVVFPFHVIARVPPPPVQSAQAFYVIPTIASNGKDGTAGNADDIYNHQLRSE